MIAFQFDREKATSAMLHICQSLGGSWDKYSLLKILYFAEQSHLATYGRPITGDTIVALPHGPVPSECYDAIKPQNVDRDIFDIEDNVVIAKIHPNYDVFSDSDIECLNESIWTYKNYDFGKLKKVSHDAAYDYTVNNIGLNHSIPYSEIAKAAGASAEMLQYIKSNSENQDCDLHASQ